MFGTQLDKDNIDALSREYVSFRDNSPSRTSIGKNYFVDGHDGVTSANGSSNRREEHMAIALWDLQQNWNNPFGGYFKFFDYQFPLKAQQTDTGVGKIDLVGISDEGQFIITELKVDTETGNPGDTPNSALLQGLRYAAIVEANLKAIADEAKKKFGAVVKRQMPIIQIVGTLKWWQQHSFDLNRSNKMQDHFSVIVDRVENKIGVSIQCLAFEYSSFEYGLDGKKPRIEPIPEFRAILLSQ
jgi:hypothetical protein